MRNWQSKFLFIMRYRKLSLEIAVKILKYLQIDHCQNRHFTVILLLYHIKVNVSSFSLIEQYSYKIYSYFAIKFWFNYKHKGYPAKKHFIVTVKSSSTQRKPDSCCYPFRPVKWFQLLRLFRNCSCNIISCCYVK